MSNPHAGLEQMVGVLFDHWQLSPGQREALPGPIDERRVRIGNLRLSMPVCACSIPITVTWCIAGRPHPTRGFPGLTPVDVMLQADLPGIDQVRNYPD